VLVKFNLVLYKVLGVAKWLFLIVCSTVKA